MRQEEASKDLVVVPPGKYLLADKNEFIRVADHTTGLLINSGKEERHSYRLVLLNDKVILI